MSKLKVGDRVIRTAPSSFEVIQGHQYFVSEVLNETDIKVEGINRLFHAGYFEPAQAKNGEITPTQAIQAYLDGEDIQYQQEDYEWENLSNQSSLKDLIDRPLRIRPKTVVINGVTVPAPLCRVPEASKSVYFCNIFKSRVYEISVDKLTFNHKNYWATYSDAQRVLNAMLLPLNH